MTAPRKREDRKPLPPRPNDTPVEQLSAEVIAHYPRTLADLGR